MVKKTSGVHREKFTLGLYDILPKDEVGLEDIWLCRYLVSSRQEMVMAHLKSLRR